MQWYSRYILKSLSPCFERVMFNTIAELKTAQLRNRLIVVLFYSFAADVKLSKLKCVTLGRSTCTSWYPTLFFVCLNYDFINFFCYLEDKLGALMYEMFYAMSAWPDFTLLVRLPSWKEEKGFLLILELFQNTDFAWEYNFLPRTNYMHFLVPTTWELWLWQTAQYVLQIANCSSLQLFFLPNHIALDRCSFSNLVEHVTLYLPSLGEYQPWSLNLLLNFSTIAKLQFVSLKYPTSIFKRITIINLFMWIFYKFLMFRLSEIRKGCF